MLPRRSTRPLSLLAAAVPTAVTAVLGSAVLAAPASAFSLNPEAGSPGVEDANTLHWIVFLAVAAIIAAVNLAILFAVRRYRGERGSTPAQTTSPRGRQTRVAAALGVLALALFVIGAVFTSSSNERPESQQDVAGARNGQPLEIEATAQQWIWRFDYPNEAFSYHKLIVPVGTTVALNLTSTDVVHAWNVPELTGKAQAVPGKANTIYFRADEEGTYGGQASVLSGQGYASMSSEVRAVPADEYESYVKQLKTDIQAAQDHVEEQIKSNQIP